MVVVDVVNEEEEEEEEEKEEETNNGRCRFLVVDETTVEENEHLVGTWPLMNKEERHMISFPVPQPFSIKLSQNPKNIQFSSSCRSFIFFCEFS